MPLNDYQRRFIGCVCLIALMSGCDESSTSRETPKLPTAKSLDAPPAAKHPVSGHAGEVQERNFNGAVFQVPSEWEESPTQSTFVIAEFQVPGADGSGRLTLSTAGGDVADNIGRWKGQFLRTPDDPAPKESSLTIDGRDATLVELFGNYQDMLKPGEPQRNSAMLGVVIPLKGTNYFVKLTGPRSTVTDARDAFLKFVESAKFKE